MGRAGTAVTLACALGLVAATPALAVENPSPRYYTADGVSDEYGGPGLAWSGPDDYGPGRTGDPDDDAFALGGAGHLVAEDASEGNFGTRPFTLRFSARFSGSGGADQQVLSKRARCRDGSFLDVRTRGGQVYAELGGSGNRGTGVLHPADVHDGAWHVITVARAGSALSVTVDRETVSGRSDGVVDLDTPAPMRFGDGPCVGDDVTRADVLLDDISYGPGPLPTERPLVPGLSTLDSIMGAPGEILAPGAPAEEADAEEDAARSETETGESASTAADERTAETAPVPAGGAAGGRGSESGLAPAARDAGPVATAPRGPSAAVGFPTDSGAAAGIAAAVLPGAGDAAARSAHPGLDWTGVLAPPAPVPAPAPVPQPPAIPADPLATALVPPPPSAPAPLSGGEVAYDPGTAAVAFADALPSPAEVRWDLGAIAQSLLLTIVLLVLLALPVGVVNSTAAANAGRIGAALSRLSVFTAWSERISLSTAVTVVAAAGAVVYGFLEPSFGFDLSSLALVIGLALAFLVVTVAQHVSRSAYMDHWWGIRAQLAPFPGFLLLGVVAVVVSRVFGLEPGLILGTLVAFGTAKVLRADEEGPAVAVSAVSLTLLGLVAWLSRHSVVAAAGSEGGFLAEVLAAALTAVAVAAAANLAFMLVPLGFLDGAALFRWSKTVWAVFAGIGMFAVVHVLLAASADAGALAGRSTFLAVVLGAYLLGAAAFWTWFRYRPALTSAADRERELTTTLP
jgi:hypothetical protein